MALTWWRPHAVVWGECDPFGLVYYPHMLAWLNDVEHDLWRALGQPIEAMIARDRTTFVMGEVAFRFTGPIRYGEPVMIFLRLDSLGRSTLHWSTRVVHGETAAPVCEGTATRVYARVQEDGGLKAAAIGPELRALLATTPQPPTSLAPTLAAVLDW